MATNRPQDDLGWKIHKKQFQLGETAGISSLDKKNTILLMWD